VEIDPKVISIAREYFALSNRTRVFNQDGRIFLSLSDSKYDIIIVDAFTQQIYIPFHLTTKNFFALAKQNLNRGGLLAINMASFSDDSRLLKSISNTLLANFEYVYRIKIPESINSLIIASEREVDFSKLSSAMNTELYLLAGFSMRVAKRVHADPNAPVLTDDKAPIEHMVDWELL
jgi:spermidine synthase